MANEYDINSYRDLAANAIEDLKNYANDGNGARLMVSYRGYTEDLERLDNTRPAAPVEGLSVAFYQVFLQGAWIDCPLSAYTVYSENGEETRKLCDQSQAEAIIAAKDERIAFLERVVADQETQIVKQSTLEADNAAKDERLKDCRSVINEFKREIKKHEADNAALAARVKELEKDVKREAQSSTHNAQDCLDEQLRAEALETQLAAARKALEKLTLYSNSLALAHVHKTQNNDGIWGALKEARAALEAKP